MRIKLVSQLIKDSLTVFQNILKYFNGAAISAFTISQLLVSVMNLALNSNELELVMSSLTHIYDIAINFWLFLNNYHLFILSYTLSLQHKHLLHYLLVYYLFVIQSVNGAECLNNSYLLFLSAVTFTPCPIRVMVPLISMYASLKSHKLDFNILDLNLILLLVLYVPLESSFISIQSFVLNLDGFQELDLISHYYISIS